MTGKSRKRQAKKARHEAIYALFATDYHRKTGQLPATREKWFRDRVLCEFDKGRHGPHA